MGTSEIKDGTFVLRDSMAVHAPVDRCFQLTCSIALVQEELGMKPVSGRTSGMVQEGDTVRWEGWQLGLKHFHVSKITACERPVFMQDTMAAGRFKTFQHDHRLREAASGETVLEDELRFTLPLGAAGYTVAKYIMVPHILKLMANRFRQIKRVAESDAWLRYIPSDK